MKPKTAVQSLIESIQTNELSTQLAGRPIWEKDKILILLKEALKKEEQQRITDYNVGYADSTCRYPNDSTNYVKNL